MLQYTAHKGRNLVAGETLQSGDWSYDYVTKLVQ